MRNSVLSAFLCAVAIAGGTLPAGAVSVEQSDANTEGPISISPTESVESLGGNVVRQIVYGSEVFADQSTGGSAKFDAAELDAYPDSSALAGVARTDDYTATLPEDGSTNPVTYEANGAKISMRLNGLASSAPEVTGNRVTYDLVGTSKASHVTLEATSAALKESIILDRPPLPGETVYFSYDIETSSGIEPAVDLQTGEVMFTSAGGLTVARVPAPFMFEKEDQNAANFSVTQSLVRTGTASWSLRLDLDETWLIDPERVYPVVVDPTITSEAPSRDCWLNQAAPDMPHCGDNYTAIRVGRESVGERRRGIIQFDPGVPAEATIESAQLRLFLDASRTLGGAEAEYAVVRPGLPSYRSSWNWTAEVEGLPWLAGDPTGAPSDYRVMDGSTSGYKSFDVTPIVRGWVTGEFPNHGLLIKQRSEAVNSVLSFNSSSVLNDKNVRPYLEVVYSLPPGIEGTTTSSIAVDDYSEDGSTIVASTETTTTSSGTESDNDGAVYPEGSYGRVETGGGGSSSASGCRKVTLRNKRYSMTGTDHLYTYTTWTDWCWSRSQKQVTVRGTGWDTYADNDSIGWEGQVKVSRTHYDWISGAAYSGHRHYRMGHYTNTYPWMGTIGHSYPVNIIRAHSNGTWTWKTDD